MVYKARGPTSWILLISPGLEIRPVGFYVLTSGLATDHLDEDNAQVNF